MKLYHCAQSRSVRALWALEELGLKYELETLPFPPRVFQKSYKELNPLGTVPFLVDGDVELSESVAICHYLVQKYGPTSLAVEPDEKDFGEYLNLLYFSDATLTFPQAVILRYSVLEPDERKLPQAVEDYTGFFLGRLRKIESALEGKQFLCAERFTIADICITYSLLFAQSIIDTDEVYSENLKGYYQRMSERPAFKFATQGKLLA